MNDNADHADALQALKSERNRLDMEEIRLARRLEEISVEKATLDRLVARFERGSSGRATNRRRAPAFQIALDEVRGLSIEDAAIKIAEKNGGRLKSTAARKVMVAAGVLADGTAGSTALYKTLNESERFDKTNRGEYRLRRKEVTAPKPSPFRSSGAQFLTRPRREIAV